MQPVQSCCGAVSVRSCDNSISADVPLASGLNDTSIDGPPLNGVMHAAGVLEDATISKQTASGVYKVFGPKVVGMINWKHRLAAQPLNMQVAFSSIAGLWGSPGQIQYSAANAALRELSSRWHGQGISALSVDWGAWAGGGMAAMDPGTAKRMERMGIGMVTPELGTASLGMCLSAPAIPPHSAISPTDWKRFLEANRALPMFDDISFANRQVKSPHDSIQAGGGVATSAGHPEIWSMPKEDRSRFLEKQVAEVVEGIIGMAVDKTEPLAAAGIDSLGAVELRNSLEARMGMQLPATLLFDYPTVHDLSIYLMDEMTPSAEAAEGAPAESIDERTVPGSNASPTTICITGIGCVLPFDATKAASSDAISVVSESRWPVDRHMDDVAGLDTLCRFGGFVHSDVAMFDAACFRVSGKEASLMDPQQRLLLHSSFESLAGARKATEDSLDYGVFVGIWLADYFMIISSAKVPAGPYSATGITSSVAAGRVSYTFGLKVSSWHPRCTGGVCSHLDPGGAHDCCDRRVPVFPWTLRALHRLWLLILLLHLWSGASVGMGLLQQASTCCWCQTPTQCWPRRLCCPLQAAVKL